MRIGFERLWEYWGSNRQADLLFDRSVCEVSCLFIHGGSMHTYRVEMVHRLAACALPLAQSRRSSLIRFRLAVPTSQICAAEEWWHGVLIILYYLRILSEKMRRCENALARLGHIFDIDPIVPLPTPIALHISSGQFSHCNNTLITTMRI